MSGSHEGARPTATYRVQLHAGFGFADAAAIVPHLVELGVSHLYCSPVLQAVPGSTHGYDVVDPTRLSEELGGADGFAVLVAALSDHGLGLVVDIVPNHMATAGRANRWWWDVLEEGPGSRFAPYFDIDWGGPDPSGRPSVLVPVLGDHLGRVIEAGELGLARRGGAAVVTYHDQELPLSPSSFGAVLARVATEAPSEALAVLAGGFGQGDKAELQARLADLLAAEPGLAAAVDAELAAVAGDPDALEALLAVQAYRLAHWRTADEELDYRRFFSITTLAGLRVEDPDVFEASHRLVGELVASGAVTGIRVDHVDGLRDPAGYLERLRRLAPRAWIVVEKILQPDEVLPEGWPVAGTTGYDQLVALDQLYVDPDGEEPLTAAYAAFTGEDRPFGEIAHEAELEVMAGELAAETERVTRLLAEVAASRRRHCDHTRSALRDAVREVVAGLAVYRTYVVPGQPVTEEDRRRARAAVDQARARRPDLDGELLDLLGRVLVLDEAGPAEAELAVRIQQLTAPVMAKGVEDTALYRYSRLLALNEVGGDPGTFGTGQAAFHARLAELAARWPATMATRSTHDTKRSGDVRARLVLLGEIPAAWAAALDRWSERNEALRRSHGPDPETEHALYQTLVGAWPIDAERVVAATIKAAREAKRVTSWIRPDEDVEADLAAFVRGVVGSPRFVEDLEAFLAEHRLVELGRRTALAQTAILATGPGVPDLYQGSERWDLSLVDPDNRRPVDHGASARLLAAVAEADAGAAVGHMGDGGAKVWLLRRLLRHRRLHPGPFEAPRYEPLAAHGPRAHHVVAFARDGLVTVVPRLLARLGDDWAGTRLTLPPGRWHDLVEGAVHDGGAPVEMGHLLPRLPAAVLVADPG